MSFEELLKNAGLQQYQQYFGTGEQVAQAFGFEGSQAEQFGKFFQPFDQQRLLDASGKIQERTATRTGFLQSDYESGFRGLTNQLGQATRQIGQTAGQSGFTRAGATAKQYGEARTRIGESIEDLMLGRTKGMYQIEQQAGQERAGLTSLLQNYLTGTMGRGEQIARLDPIKAGAPPGPSTKQQTIQKDIQEILQANPTMSYEQALGIAEQSADRL
jgi:hypothetical protein